MPRTAARLLAPLGAGKVKVSVFWGVLSALLGAHRNRAPPLVVDAPLVRSLFSRSQVKACRSPSITSFRYAARSMPASRAVGIDLGATRTAIARIDELGRSGMVRDAQGDMLVPSAVYFEDDEWLHGRSAKLAAATQPGRAAEFYKRDLGQASYSRAVGGELVPPEAVEAGLLKKLLADLAGDGTSKPAVVLAMPASFNQAQRRARLDAAKIAGVDVLGTINDPLAAALAFAESQGYLSEGSTKPGQRVLVFDLGGSKLDVAIVEIKPGRLRTMAIGGNMRLGGREWDLRLAEFLAEQFAKQFGDDPRHDMISVRRLLESAEEAKQSLTARNQARVQVQRNEDSAAIIVTRQSFEDLTADLLDEALQLVEAALRRAGMAWRDLSNLLLVGGATRMPAVATRLTALTGLNPATAVHPDEVVARGAAFYASCLLAAREKRKSPLNLTITDMTVHSLGLEWSDAQTGRLENVVLIARGSELPCGTVAKAITDIDDQSTIAVQLLEGESRVADQCARIAQLTIRDLPAGLPAGSQINVQYHFSAEGRLQVKAQVPRTGQPLPINLRREQGLSENQITDWKQALAGRGGLQALHALLAKHERERQAQADAEAAMAPPSPPPMRPPALPAQAYEHTESEFSLQADDEARARRMNRRRMTPRKIAILIGGYIVSALVGTAIGYYILMRIDPSYNWWNLQLPGLQIPPVHGTAPADSHFLANLLEPRSRST
jgi:molecular chaperone DnaK